jgi:Bacterial PH domain
MVKMEKAFGIIPAAPGTFTFIWVLCVFIGLILVGVIGLFAYSGYQVNRTTFTVTNEGLKIGPGLYSRFIPKEDIDVAGVSAVNLNAESGYKPGMRLNGIGLPGYSGGWYKLKNKQKVLMFVTDKARVVYIPTYKNYALMLSVEEPGEFLSAMLQWK